MTRKQTARLCQRIVAALTPELLRPQYRRSSPGRNRLYGHCYVASEAFYHLAGAAKSNFSPCVIKHEGSPHWYLKHKLTGEIIDLTRAQFETPVPYQNGRGIGFLTLKPSKRATIVMDRVSAAASSSTR